VLVFSSYSNKSPHVMREVERAASKGIPILPLRIEDVPPSKSMEYFISRTHWLDALTPPLEKHLQRLADTVIMLLARTGVAEQLGDERGAPVPPPSAETALERGLGRPPPSGGAFEVAKRWAGRPLARVALGFGAIAAVIIIVLVALLCDGEDGERRGFVPPVPDEGSPTPTPTPTPTPAPTVTPPDGGTGPTGNPGTLWVSSIPLGGKVYVAPQGSLEAGYPGPPIPDESYFIGTTPLEIEMAPGEYDVAVKIETAEDREFAADGAAVTLTVRDGAENIIERGRIYEIVKEPDEQETVIALFQVADEPYSALLDTMPAGEWLFDFKDEVLTRELTKQGVPEAEIPTVLEILHRGGKIVLEDTGLTVVIEMMAEGFSVSEWAPSPD